MLLHYALKIYNETDSNKIDSRIAYTKLRVLFLLKHYSQGEEFVRSLDENIFFKPYHKKNVSWFVPGIAVRRKRRQH